MNTEKEQQSALSQDEREDENSNKASEEVTSNEVATNSQKKPISAKKITILAIMLALTIIFSFVPVSFGTVTLALMIVPTLIVALTQDFKTTLVMGCLLGVINFIAWYTTKAAIPVAPIFRNPIICIIPRVLIGVVAYLVNKGVNKLIVKMKKTEKDENGEEVVTFSKKHPLTIISSAIATACGVLTNTVFVGIFTLLFFNNRSVDNFVININYILAWFGLNFLIEIISFTLIIPPIVYALKKAKLV